ncbi:BCCT family transporter [Bacillus shivajii]|uniref:BCCT family transporter n=1 Tax=Bacillus shivajii TaxID=1983719 RepID=UPI001CFA0D6D|nr:BCCT family transporter [Bacillus shivajii]UCZ51551.1 BCCT family transporter [Bacillus shivajii]
MNKDKIDWPFFCLAFFILISLCITIFSFPYESEVWLQTTHDLIMNKVGIFYLWVGFSSFLFLMWVAFSKYGRIKLGPRDAKPSFSTVSWIALMFCAGIGSSIIYWGTIEWSYYYVSPPFGLPSGSPTSIEWSAAYGLFHTGPTAWAIYTLPALPIAYLYHVKGRKVLKISEACRPVLKQHSDGLLGRVIDLLFMLGLLGAAGTSLGLSIPMISAGVQKLTGISHSYRLDIFILLLCTIIFSFSVYAGLEKGIKKLSDINVFLALTLLFLVLLLGPTIFILKMSTNSIGLIADHFLRLNTWIDPVAQSGFPEKWTLFYWAWWIVYAPFIGLFIAKVSRGRTIKQMIIGTILSGSLGCWLFFSILGNYGLYLELHQILPVTLLVQHVGAPEAIMSIFATLPFGTIMVFMFTILSIIFLSTTFDTSSYMLAAVTQKQVARDPARWNRLFWAFSLALPPVALMFIGGLTSLQTVTIIAALPSLFIMVLLAVSFLKLVKNDE